VAGCNLLDRSPPPSIETTPPYWQPQSQLEELRSFHEKESAKIADDMHVFRNHEMARLENAGKELEKDKLWQEDYEKTLERRNKMTSWFKSKSKGTTSDMPTNAAQTLRGHH
jgi:hypothetical protein